MPQKYIHSSVYCKIKKAYHIIKVLALDLLIINKHIILLAFQCDHNMWNRLSVEAFAFVCWPNMLWFWYWWICLILRSGRNAWQSFTRTLFFFADYQLRLVGLSRSFTLLWAIFPIGYPRRHSGWEPSQMYRQSFHQLPSSNYVHFWCHPQSVNGWGRHHPTGLAISPSSILLPRLWLP